MVVAAANVRSEHKGTARHKSYAQQQIGHTLTAVSFSEFVLWVVRLYAAAEMSMNSVERVGECE
jgi:hypothetical protein